MPTLFYTATPCFEKHTAKPILITLQEMAATIGLTLTPIPLTQKVGQKWLKQVPEGQLLLDTDGSLSLIANGMKVNPNWQGLQQRVVRAGKKTELLLKVAKLQVGMSVIDATAGFGHDSLILASTGSHVTMVEQNPLMFLLLIAEQHKMQHNPNWQKLLARIDIYFGQMNEILPTLPKINRVYLDPMFPHDSYKSAVSKSMQVLHNLVAPPSLTDEIAMLDMAKHQLTAEGRVIVKRPKNAPFLANCPPIESASNDVVRFDSYH